MCVQAIIRSAFPRNISISRFSLVQQTDVGQNFVQRKFCTSIKPISMVYSKFGSDKPQDVVPVIIMHGLFGSKTNWYSMGRTIASETQKKVFIVDARNHGDSPHSNEHTYFHLAEDISHFMSENNIGKAAVIGHSMGGRAMMTFALQYPEKVESLIVADISPVGTPKSMSNMKTIFDAMMSIGPIIGKSLSAARHMVEAQLTQILNSKELSTFLSMNLGPTKSGDITWKINLKTIVENYHPNITVFPITKGEFNGPTIFVRGEFSDFVNMNHVDKIKLFFPNATFVTIEDAGHWLHAEQPKKFAEIACSFIKSAKSTT